jgi:hypothetical protein
MGHGDDITAGGRVVPELGAALERVADARLRELAALH